MSDARGSAGEPDTLLTVEVAYALPHEQRILALTVPPGTTAMDAAKRSGIVDYFPGLILDDSTRLGIFGQIVAQSQVLAEGDRVEIYRPLIADPKEVRKERAARAKARRGSASGDGVSDQIADKSEADGSDAGARAGGNSGDRS